MDFKDVKLIQEIVDREDSKDFMDKLISFYCLQSSGNCQHLIELIPQITSQQIRFYSDTEIMYGRLNHVSRNLSNMRR